VTPLERLLAEELPTGTFGDRPPPTAPRTTAPSADPHAARHRAELLAALDADRRPARHLHVIPDAAA
jgi:hypothetical protein